MNIENQIKQFILKNLYFADKNSLGDDDSFLETGVVDSTGVMELVAFVQTEFGVTVEAQEIVVDNFDSVSKVARFVRRKTAQLPRPDLKAAPVATAEPAPVVETR